MDANPGPILVVDDLRDGADTQVLLLQLWGYDAAAYYDGASALAAARARPPRAVLVDVVMPSMSGYEFTSLFRQLPGCGGVPVIAITGRTDAPRDARAREAGMDEVLIKPADPDRVEGLLRWHLGEAERGRRAAAAAPGPREPVWACRPSDAGLPRAVS